MNPNDVAPMVVAVTLILVSGGVILLRPLARRLGAFLDQATLEKQRNPTADPAQQEERLAQLVEGMDLRLARLEERVNFTEAMLLSKAREAPPALPGEPRPGAARPPEPGLRQR